jgi:hypothetical protein
MPFLRAPALNEKICLWLWERKGWSLKFCPLGLHLETRLNHYVEVIWEHRDCASDSENLLALILVNELLKVQTLLKNLGAHEKDPQCLQVQEEKPPEFLLENR